MTKKEILNLLKHLKLDPKGEFVLNENEREFVKKIIEVYLKEQPCKP